MTKKDGDKERMKMAKRAEYSPFGTDLELMAEAKRLAMNNLYLFDQTMNPQFALVALNQTYNYYRWPKSMLGDLAERKKTDAEFEKLRKKIWAFQASSSRTSRYMHYSGVRNQVVEQYREIRGELSVLLDKVMFLAQERGLGIPASVELSARKKIDMGIDR